MTEASWSHSCHPVQNCLKLCSRILLSNPLLFCLENSSCQSLSVTEGKFFGDFWEDLSRSPSFLKSRGYLCGWEATYRDMNQKVVELPKSPSKHGWFMGAPSMEPPTISCRYLDWLGESSQLSHVTTCMTLGLVNPVSFVCFLRLTHFFTPKS